MNQRQSPSLLGGTRSTAIRGAKEHERDSKVCCRGLRDGTADPEPTCVYVKSSISTLIKLGFSRHFTLAAKTDLKADVMADLLLSSKGPI